MSGTLSTDLRNLPELLASRAVEIGDERFVRDAHQEWTYGEFAARVAEVAAGLRGHGVGEGDVVGVILPNSPHYLEVWWGILWLGAVFNPVNPALTTREAVGILSDSKASCVVATADAAAGLEEHREQLPALRELIVAGDPDLAAPLRGHGSAEEPASFGPDQLASFVYTSGTTGRPKGAMLSHGNLLMNAWQLGEPLPVGRGDTLGMVLPLFHVNAQVVTTVLPLYLGAQVAMWERFSASRFWQEVDRFEPVTFSSVPTMLAALLHAPGADEAETNSLRFVICGAAPLSPALFRRFEEKFGLKIMEGYGLTEGTCCSTINPFYGPRKVGSIGLPTRGQEVVIFDEESGEIAGPGVVGEVGVRGANVMAGYYERPDANAETLRDGWLHTGDVGYRDEDGYFFLVDRVKDMIIRGGENIYPREIEDALLENPNVKEAAVVGRPDEVRGEEVHAVVALIEGDDVVALEEHCRERLAAFKVPSSWEVVAELPKTSTGKIDKKPLRARLADAAPQ
ncbi:MAG TPA: AMP-binding protein [Solirubrobacterales bacterium]|jgi:acyl-CoA synthetase (AMP-forming)/AMP-acid ligase II|nr:AMP-binding protein [Solirubrobacterales bacterium]